MQRPHRPHGSLADGNRPAAETGLRARLHEIIFEADTPAGKAFDLLLLVAICMSVVAVILESVGSIRAEHGPALIRLEWAFTILFTIEYALRLASVDRPLRYATSFYGIVDLLSIIPTYLTLLPLGTDTRSLLLIRSLRLLRIFRVLKLARYVGEASDLRAALHASQAKIFVFLWTVLLAVLVVGAAMYLIEGPAEPFSSIPASIYWAIVTMTTVGYGDMTPETVSGKILASALMIAGYGIIAVPTGIVSAEMAARRRPDPPVSTRCCRTCAAEGHPIEAEFCWRCGTALHEPPPQNE